MNISIGSSDGDNLQAITSIQDDLVHWYMHHKPSMGCQDLENKIE